MDLRAETAVRRNYPPSRKRGVYIQRTSDVHPAISILSVVCARIGDEAAGASVGSTEPVPATPYSILLPIQLDLISNHSVLAVSSSTSPLCDAAQQEVGEGLEKQLFFL